MIRRPDSNFVFVVDTDMYAGNFERELTAFCTGQLDESDVALELAKLFREQCPEMVDVLEDLVERRAGENGYISPTTIWPTPGYWNDGLGNEWPDEKWGTPEVLQAYVEARTKHRMEPTTNEPGRHPAYRSVAIFLRRRPPNDVLDFLMERAVAFSNEHHRFNITGFHLIQETTTQTTLWRREGRPASSPSNPEPSSPVRQ